MCNSGSHYSNTCEFLRPDQLFKEPLLLSNVPYAFYNPDYFSCFVENRKCLKLIIPDFIIAPAAYCFLGSNICSFKSFLCGTFITNPVSVSEYLITVLVQNASYGYTYRNSIIFVYAYYFVILV